MVYNPNPDKPEQKNKNYHENTKVRKHEKLNVFLFRAFNLSCFRDYLLKFSARKNTNLRTKELIVIVSILQEHAFSYGGGAK